MFEDKKSTRDIENKKTNRIQTRDQMPEDLIRSIQIENAKNSTPTTNTQTAENKQIKRIIEQKKNESERS